MDHVAVTDGARTGRTAGHEESDHMASRSATILARVRSSEAGMTTAEYAVGTIATCGMGGLLYKVLTSDTVMQLLTDLIRAAARPFLG